MPQAAGAQRQQEAKRSVAKLTTSRTAQSRFVTLSMGPIAAVRVIG
jgi:hypothetical protein